MTHRSVNFDFSDNVVLISGAARGQGLSHAEAFAQAGATVIGVDIAGTKKQCGLQYNTCSESEFALASDAFANFGRDSRLIDLDITDTAALKKLQQAVRRTTKNIDIVINNAGVNIVKKLEDYTDEDISLVVGVNLIGSINITRYFAPLIDPRSHGSIIFVSSLAARRSGASQAVYASSKAALEGLTRSLAVELGVRNIRVNCIVPTLVVTPQTVGLSATHPIDYIRAMSAYALPNFEGLSAREVSQAILFLCSDAARSVTGHSLILDCGRLAKA